MEAKYMHSPTLGAKSAFLKSTFAVVFGSKLRSICTDLTSSVMSTVLNMSLEVTLVTLMPPGQIYKAF